MKLLRLVMDTYSTPASLGPLLIFWGLLVAAAYHLIAGD